MPPQPLTGPGKYRNVSGTLLELNDFAVLFDCGEGTLGQLYRLFGDKLFGQILERIKFIFISHLHADHHAGTLSLIKACPNPTVVAPYRFRLWLEEYSQCALLPPFVFIPAEEAINKEYSVSGSGMTFRAVSVDHCPKAFGYVVYTNSDKVVFSGDTRPCEALIEAGLDATLLIHEATLTDDLLEEAIARKHSSVNEAIEVAKRMAVRNTLLTHFSQRYSKCAPIITNDARVILGFDLLRLSLSDFSRVSSYNAKLAAMLPVTSSTKVVVVVDDNEEIK